MRHSPKPPAEPKPFRLTIRELVLSIPTVVVLLGLSILAGLPLALSYRAGQADAAVTSQAPLEQRWTAGTGAVASMAPMAVRGALPPPDPRQRRPPCAAAIGEESINGVCWLRLDIRPPCPKDPEAYAWEHNGKCYAYSMKAAGVPTSGEGRPLGVADP